jgi:phosphinothricin acetyltransferase
MIVRTCEQKDFEAVCDIYNYYVENTIITFEEEPVTQQAMADRITAAMQSFPWLVCEVDDGITGYAYATRWHGRSAYRYSVEVTVYVRYGEGAKGYGQALYGKLLRLLAGRYHALVAGISLPNEGSVRLHEKFGFRKVAHFSEVGRKFGRWIDVGYWQKIAQDEPDVPARTRDAPREA